MSSRLQLDVRNLSLGMRHLVNAYEVKEGIGVIASNTVWLWSMPERLACTVLQKWAICKYTYLYTFILYLPPAQRQRIARWVVFSSLVSVCSWLCLSVCFSVRQRDNSWTVWDIIMKFVWKQAQQLGWVRRWMHSDAQRTIRWFNRILTFLTLQLL